MASLEEQFRRMGLSSSSRRTMEGEVLEGVDPVTGEAFKRVTGLAVRGSEPTIVIWLKTHGVRLQKEPLDNSDSKLSKMVVFSRPANICPTYEVDTVPVMEIFRKARSQPNIEQVLEFMQSHAIAEMVELKRIAAQRVQQVDALGGESYGKPYDERVKEYDKAPYEYIMREPRYDHGIMADRKDPNKYSSGIFILACNFNDALLAPLLGLADNIMYSDESTKELQSYNLLNESVLLELSMRMVGEPFDLEYVKPTVIDSEVGGIRQYQKVRLSQFLKFFKRLGVEKVIVIDDSCQSGSFRFDADAEEIMAAETDPLKRLFRTSVPVGSAEMREPPGPFGHYGGTIKRKKTRRRKNKRNRSSKFHKK